MKQLAYLSLVAVLVCACESPASPSDAKPAGLLGITPDPVVRIDLGTLGGPSSYAEDVNNDGTAVGWSETSSGVDHAFSWTALSGMVDLGTLPGDDRSRAVAITDDGKILGYSAATGQEHRTPVVWTSGDPSSIAELPIPLLPNAPIGEPTGFNEQGEVVGWDLVAHQDAWYWSESRGKIDITHLSGFREGVSSGINALGVVVGTSLDYRLDSTGFPVSFEHAFVWSFENGYRDLGTPDGDPNASLQAWGINDDGTVVGNAGPNAFRWKDGDGFTLLPTLPGSAGRAMAVSANATAVGVASYYPSPENQAVAWPATGGVLRLNPDDSHSSVATGINDQRWVVGWSGVDMPVPGNHATLWIIPPSLDGIVAGVVASPAVASSFRESNSCFADTKVLMSKQTLVACAIEPAK